MIFYWLLMIIILLMGLIIYKGTRLRKDDKNILFVFFSFLMLTFISAVRYEVGFDYGYVYAPMFREICDVEFSQLLTTRHEPGFVILEYLISRLTNNFQWLFIITSILCMSLICLFFYKYSKNMVLSIFLFLSFGLYYCSMNFIRQTIAAFIVIFAIQKIKNKKLVQYIFLVFLAAMFHKTALIMLPFYFILQIKITKKILGLYSAATVIFLLTSTKILNFIVEKFFPWYLEGDSNYIFNGIDFYNVIIPIILFAILFAFQERLCKEDEKNHILVACGFFSMFFYVVALRHAILDRFSLYFEPVVIIAITQLVYTLSKANDLDKSIKNAITAVILVLGVVSNTIYLVVDGHFVTPYKSIFYNESYNFYLSSLQPDNEGSDTPVDDVEW